MVHGATIATVASISLWVPRHQHARRPREQRSRPRRRLRVSMMQTPMRACRMDERELVLYGATLRFSTVGRSLTRCPISLSRLDADLYETHRGRGARTHRNGARSVRRSAVGGTGAVVASCPVRSRVATKSESAGRPPLATGSLPHATTHLRSQRPHHFNRLPARLGCRPSRPVQPSMSSSSVQPAVVPSMC